MKLGDGAHQVQAQAQAGDLAHVATAEVAGGEVLELVRGDALALVRDLEVEPALPDLGPQVHGGVRRGILEGVVQEVQQGGAQQVAVAEGGCGQLVQVRPQLAPGGIRGPLHHVGQQLGQGHGLGLEGS